MRRIVGLVLHLEHDGHDLVALLVAFAEDEVALRALGRVVVLLEVRARKRGGADLVELGLAVLLQRLAHHLGGQARLHVLVALDLAVLVGDDVVLGFELDGQLLFEGALASALLGVLERHLRGQRVALALQRRTRLLHRQLLLRLEGATLRLHTLLQLDDAGVLRSRRVGQRPLALGVGQALLALALTLLRLQPRLQLGDARLLLSRVALRFRKSLGHGQLHGLLLLGGHQLLVATHLLVELGVAHLLQNGRETGLVDGEHLAAMGALDLVHARSFSRIPRFYPIAAHRQPSFRDSRSDTRLFPRPAPRYQHEGQAR